MKRDLKRITYVNCLLQWRQICHSECIGAFELTTYKDLGNESPVYQQNQWVTYLGNYLYSFHHGDKAETQVIIILLYIPARVCFSGKYNYNNHISGNVVTSILQMKPFVYSCMYWS